MHYPEFSECWANVGQRLSPLPAVRSPVCQCRTAACQARCPVTISVVLLSPAVRQ